MSDYKNKLWTGLSGFIGHVTCQTRRSIQLIPKRDFTYRLHMLTITSMVQTLDPIRIPCDRLDSGPVIGPIRTTLSFGSGVLKQVQVNISFTSIMQVWNAIFKKCSFQQSRSFESFHHLFPFPIFDSGCLHQHFLFQFFRGKRNGGFSQTKKGFRRS